MRASAPASSSHGARLKEILSMKSLIARLRAALSARALAPAALQDQQRAGTTFWILHAR